MGRREICPCCLQEVTKAQLKKHAEEAARKQSIIAMGGDSTTPAATLRVLPITGNDIFASKASAPAPTLPVDDSTPCPDISMGSPPPVPPPYPIPRHSIADDDFPPDVVEHPHNPQVPEPPDYPSMEMSDVEDSSETEDEDQGRVEGEPNLNDFMDWEYLKQGKYCLLCRLRCIVGLRCISAGNLTKYELAICRAFTFLVRSQLTKEQYPMIQETWPEISQFYSEHVLRSKAQALAGVEPLRFDCCVNSCVCFTGHYASLEKCPRCNQPRFEVGSHGKKKPRSQFFYIPLIPRLIAYLKSPPVASAMQYRSQHQHVPGSFRDIFDGTNYQALQSAPITIHGEPIDPPTTYFQDPRDIALGLSTDGYGILTHGQATAWPLILFNYNLSPEMRFHSDNLLALGVIPGPNKPGDIDSFLVPLAEVFFLLAAGVGTYDVLSESQFILRAFLLIVFGDFPAVSMLMKMKGVNGISPCRSCKIKAIPVPTDNNRTGTYYVPPSTDLTGLGRSHGELMAQADLVDKASTKAEAEMFSKEFGIKGRSILSELDSMSFPQSFPPDFMHIAWENVTNTLVTLWSGDYKGLDEGNHKYHINKAAWKEVGARGAASSANIPSTFGPQIPNIFEKGSFMTADMWSFWVQFLAPVFLRDSFEKPECYEHFIDLVYLFGLCLQRDISAADVDTIRTGFINWVDGYSRCVRFIISDLLTR